MSFKYLSKQTLKNNPNTQYGLDQNVQNMLTNGNAQFIIDIALQMRLGHSITSLGLHIAIIFFQQKCYVNYDRFIILAASLLLATKLKDMDSRLRMLCSVFHKIIVRQNALNMSSNSITSSEAELYTQQKYKRIKQQIMIAQAQLLRTLQYNLQFTCPNEYIKKYCDLFYPYPLSQRNQSLSTFQTRNKQLNKRLFYGTRVLVLDSYRTRVSLLFSPLVIFVTCFLFACRYQKILPYRSQKIKALYQQKYEKQTIQKVSPLNHPMVDEAQDQKLKKIRSERGADIKQISQHYESTHMKATSMHQGNQTQQQMEIQKQEKLIFGHQKAQKLLTQSTPITSDINISGKNEDKKEKDFKMYMMWLQFISKEEEENVTPKMVKECMEMINDLLKLWGTHNN